MLTLTGITKTFNPGTLNEKKALQGIDLHLDAGDFAAIVGSNGAGKSTLFNAIAGNFFTDTGRIAEPTQTAPMPIQKSIGYMEMSSES